MPRGNCGVQKNGLLTYDKVLQESIIDFGQRHHSKCDQVVLYRIFRQKSHLDKQ